MLLSHRGITYILVSNGGVVSVGTLTTVGGGGDDALTVDEEVVEADAESAGVVKSDEP